MARELITAIKQVSKHKLVILKFTEEWIQTALHVSVQEKHGSKIHYCCLETKLVIWDAARNSVLIAG